MSSNQPIYASQEAEPPLGFRCALVAQGPRVARVTLSGELDMAAAPQANAALSDGARGSSLVILDLSELTFMDSSGLHTILGAAARLAEADCRLMLVPGGRQVQQVFEITGTNQLLEFVSSPNGRLPDGPVAVNSTKLGSRSV